MRALVRRRCGGAVKMLWRGAEMVLVVMTETSGTSGVVEDGAVNTLLMMLIER